MGLSPSGGRNGGGGISGGGYLCIPPPEYSRTVYCKQAHYGPLSGGVEEARVKDDQAVLVVGRTGCVGDAGGGSGGGKDRGGG